jgi:hypothetical protein
MVAASKFPAASGASRQSSGRVPTRAEADGPHQRWQHFLGGNMGAHVSGFSTKKNL